MIILRGQNRLSEYSEGSYEPARELFRQAISLDPSFARAYSSLAISYMNEVMTGYSDNPEESLSIALELTDNAISIDQTLPHVYFSRSFALLLRKHHSEAVEHAQRDVEIDPNYADALAMEASVHTYRKDGASFAFDPMERAIKLNPNYSSEYQGILSQAHFWTGDYTKALEYLEIAINRNPNNIQWHIFAAAAYMKLGRTDDAEWSVVQIESLYPDFSIEQWARERPFEDPSQLDQMLADLKSAGL
ncbi:MAG: adenylate cyclase [Parasphingorhabdus sp.]|jgi:adenylate cyclase